ncbi:hypothetical protein JIR001_17420 [Polycladomyces abyssicola]|uniref:Uncharacterized protein n=1 Tax=Polycladomyces abyssicola TaxID=1125966 RepID=A0A8D5ZKY6_9BACL|nr:hypothetical protein JIR001_17420 [Polycladomyces abyssicola]
MLSHPAVYQDVLQLVKFCLDQSEQFIKMCRTIRDQSEALKDNLTAKAVINHIIRESEYFIGIAQTILYQQ